MHKMVNGKRIDLTPQEIEEREARIAAKIEERNKTLYRDLREKEYPSTDDLIVAMWESLVEGDDVALNELQSKRLAVKAKYPKPGVEK